MKRHFDIAIVGGGASGLFCACVVKSKNPSLSVAVIEKQSTIGKKLLATGNGRCNLTNIGATDELYHGSFKYATKNLLKTCPPELIINIFKSMGLLTTIDSEGRVYPLSRQSNSVLDILTLNCQKHNVDIICDTKITNITHSGELYTVYSDNVSFTAKNIVIASGSKATPETGADDSILGTLKNLNHNITPLSPALCSVRVKSKVLNSLKGVRAQGEATIYSDKKPLKTERGEIQFTDKTLSGICIFNLSRIANTETNTEIKLSLLPDMNTYEINEMLKDKLFALKKEEPAESLLIGIFNRKICSALIKEVGIDKTKTIAELTKSDINKLAEIINNWTFSVIKSDDFSRAQVVAGGVDGAQINPLTMESKVQKNMYIIGEAVDCDGDCGGLNLQFAFSSAYCAACELAK